MANGTVKRFKNEIREYGQVTIPANSSDYYAVDGLDINKFAIVPYQSGYNYGSQLKLSIGIIKANKWLISVNNPTNVDVTFNLFYIVIPC